MQPVDRVVGLDQSHDAGPLEAHGLPHEAAGELQRVGSRLADVGTLVAAYSNVGVGINELILDSGTWETALPATVEAVFYPKSCAYPREQRALECQGSARKTHREFLHKYDLTAEQVPLLVLDVGNWEEPFDVPFEHE